MYIVQIQKRNKLLLLISAHLVDFDEPFINFHGTLAQLFARHTNCTYSDMTHTCLWSPTSTLFQPQVVRLCDDKIRVFGATPVTVVGSLKVFRKYFRALTQSATHGSIVLREWSGRKQFSNAFWTLNSIENEYYEVVLRNIAVAQDVETIMLLRHLVLPNNVSIVLHNQNYEENYDMRIKSINRDNLQLIVRRNNCVDLFTTDEKRNAEKKVMCIKIYLRQ